MILSLQHFFEDGLRSFGLLPATVHNLTFVLMLLPLACTAWFFGYVGRRAVVPLVLRIVEHTDNKWDDYLLSKRVLRAICRMVPGIAFYKLLPLIFASAEEYGLPLAYGFTLRVTEIYITVTAILFATAFLDNITAISAEHHKLKDHHFVGIIQFLKLIMYCLGGIVIVALLLGRNPVNAIAGLGAAATVLMLVFKDSILGLVAGIQLSANKMMKPGDWVTIKKLDIDGVVEQVSLTTVKIRNFDNTISTVPPYTLVSDSFQNWDAMKRSGCRRVKRALFIDVNSIRFVAPDELPELPEEVRTKEKEQEVNLTLFRRYAECYLRGLPHIADASRHWVLARQLAPTPQGLPVELWFYFSETEFVSYEHLAAEAMEHLIAIMPRFGLRLYQAPAGSDFRPASPDCRTTSLHAM